MAEIEPQTRFTFTKPYHFKCKEKCGMCCHQKGLLLTENDYKRLKHVSNNQIKLKPVDVPGFHYEMMLETKRCPFLKETQCSIYKDRPIICRIYPLSMAFSPNGELFINLLRCPEVSVLQGKMVNPEILTETLKDIQNTESAFLLQKKEREINAIPKEFFDMKRLFYQKIGQWVSCSILKGQNIEVKGNSVAHAFLAVIDIKKTRKMSVLDSDLDRTVSLVEKKVMYHLPSSLSATIEQRRRQLKRSLKKNRVKLTLDENEPSR
jgi:Fe-S-cluster containining protein